MRRRARAVLLVTALLAVSCSSSGDENEQASSTPTESPTEAPTPVLADLDEFCEPANGFVTDSDARLITTPNAEVFVGIDTQLARLEAVAPAEVGVDVATLRTGYEAINQAYATTGYEPRGSFVLDPQIQDANSAAVGSLTRFLLQNCDLEQVRAQQIEDITLAFGVEDRATAECLHTQMGNVANIASSSLTPELMTAPVCGTSIFGLLSGESTE